MKDNELLVQAVKAQKALARRNLAAKYWVLLALRLGSGSTTCTGL
jgi:hypothetical protein